MHGVAHRIGEGRVHRLSATRELKLLGGEMRPVSIRLLWKSTPGGPETKAVASFNDHVGRVSKIVHLIPR